jgi:hypothetical protein
MAAEHLRLSRWMRGGLCLLPLLALGGFEFWALTRAELDQRRRELVVESQDDLRVMPERSRMAATFTLVDLDALYAAISRTENETMVQW